MTQNLQQITNPFPDPDSINPEINKTVKQTIKEIFDKNGCLEFFHVMTYLEKSKEENNSDLSQIIAYYCCNMIKNSNNSTMTPTEKVALINGMYREIYANVYDKDYNDVNGIDVNDNM